MLIFDNNLRFQQLNENGFEKYPNKRDLLILCEEWSKENQDIHFLQQKIIEFCTKWNDQFIPAQNESLILSTIKQVQKQITNGKSFEFNTNVIIYKSEYETIVALKDKQLQKLAFVLVCLAKWRNANYIYINSKSSIKLKDIFELAEIKCSKKEQALMLHRLNSCGFTDVQLKPLLKLFIPSICPVGDVVLEFKIGYNLLQYYKDISYPHCKRCGNAFERMANNQIYCKECGKIIKNEKTKEIMNKKRLLESRK